jgi:hypothetical protein
MNRNILKIYFITLVTFASVATLYSFFKPLDDNNLQNKLTNLENQNKILENKINNIKIEELQNEIIKNKLELLKINLEECNQNSNREISLLKSMDKTSIDS